jgi:hypothetical protein
MKTVTISGFGGSYEWGCQRMLQLGIEFLQKHPEFVFEGAYASNPNVTGICLAMNERAKQLDDAIMNDPILQEKGVTGAMHQFVIGHLVFIQKHGHDKWLEHMSAHREPCDFFEFDGTERSIPLEDFTAPNAPAKI